MKLSIIIPLYNEENSIQTVLRELLEMNWPTPISDFEIIVVNDFSSDNSLQLSNEVVDISPLVKVISHKKNLGKGVSLRTGVNASDGDLLFFQDADTELLPSDIPKMIEVLNGFNAEFVNGSRFLEGVIRPTFAYRRYMINRLFSSLVSLLVDVKLTDIACGHKLITRKLYQQLNLNEDRFGIEAELIIKVCRIQKNKIFEVPVSYFPRNYGEGKKFKNIDGIRVLWAILKYGFFQAK